jgi:23S rRNA pseudouridine2605 synthase
MTWVGNVHGGVGGCAAGVDGRGRRGAERPFAQTPDAVGDELLRGGRCRGWERRPQRRPGRAARERGGALSASGAERGRGPGGGRGERLGGGAGRCRRRVERGGQGPERRPRRAARGQGAAWASGGWGGVGGAGAGGGGGGARRGWRGRGRQNQGRRGRARGRKKLCAWEKRQPDIL